MTRDLIIGIDAGTSVSNDSLSVSAYGSPVHTTSAGLPSAYSIRFQRWSACELSSSIRFRLTSSSRVVCSARSM